MSLTGWIFIAVFALEGIMAACLFAWIIWRLDGPVKSDTVAP